MKIRPAKKEDINELHRIHDAAVLHNCRDSYSEEQIDVWLRDRSPEMYLEKMEEAQFLVLEDEEQIKAYVAYIPGEIRSIFVDPKFQKQGLGKLLLDQAFSKASEGQAKVKVVATLNAVPFYEKNSFRRIKDDTYTIHGVISTVVIMECSVS